MALIIAGDIGGTKTILRLAQVEFSEGEDRPQCHTLHTERYASGDFRDLVPMVQQFLTTAQGAIALPEPPQKACFGVAGPVAQGMTQPTNLHWPALSEQRLKQALGLETVRLINDFLAVGYGVAGLGPEDYYTLQAGEPQTDAPIAILGAGTGLGEAFVIPTTAGPCAFATEGGHTDFAPRSPLEFELRQYLLEKHQLDRVSTERVVSGQGIVAIYQFLRDRQVVPESEAIRDVVRTWEQEAGQSAKSVEPAAAIAQAAQHSEDELCRQAMEMFISAYGAEAGNLALKLLPRGGLYVAGGIAAKNLPLIREGGFLEAFCQKGRVSVLLQRVPVHIVLNPEVGLIGAALHGALL